MKKDKTGEREGKKAQKIKRKCVRKQRSKMPQMPFPSPLRQLSPILGSGVTEGAYKPSGGHICRGGWQHKRFRPQSVTICKIGCYCFSPQVWGGYFILFLCGYMWVFFFAFSKRGFRFEKTKNIRTKSFPFIIIYICKYECEMRGVFKCVAIFLLSSTVLF